MNNSTYQTLNTKTTAIILISGAVLILIIWMLIHKPSTDTKMINFNGERALQDVNYQLSLGPRVPGSESHEKIIDWMQNELQLAGWQVDIQEVNFKGKLIRNVIAKWGQGSPWVILGAHYDSRLIADQDKDPEIQKLPVLGANDGASGVAVLMEIARILPAHLEQNRSSNKNRPKQVWLVFFDAEDNGGIPGWEWIMGSQAFVAELEGKPDAAIIVDMIGDKELEIFMEKNSDPRLNREIWHTAGQLGYSAQFVSSYKHVIYDDHIPFIKAGIPAVDIIDFDYPYWHTSQDTLDKVSAESLRVVGETLLAWLLH